MAESDPRPCRRQPVTFALDHAAKAPSPSIEAKAALMMLKARNSVPHPSVEDRVAKAFMDGREQGNVDSWIAGSKVGVLCGFLIGLFVGVSGALAFVKLGLAA